MYSNRLINEKIEKNNLIFKNNYCWYRLIFDITQLDIKLLLLSRKLKVIMNLDDKKYL